MSSPAIRRAGSHRAHHLSHPVFPADNQIFTLALHDAAGKQIIVEKYLAERYMGFPDS
jgi:hypothetical protein